MPAKEAPGGSPNPCSSSITGMEFQLAHGCPTTDSTSQHPLRQAWSRDYIMASMPHFHIISLRKLPPSLSSLPSSCHRLEDGHGSGIHRSKGWRKALEGTRAQMEQR